MKTNDPIKLIKKYIEKAEEQQLYGEIKLIFEKGRMVRIKETKNYQITK
jgi:hypothetical protein